MLPLHDATHELPNKKYPGVQSIQVLRLVQVAQPVGHGIHSSLKTKKLPSHDVTQELPNKKHSEVQLVQAVLVQVEQQLGHETQVREEESE